MKKYAYFTCLLVEYRKEKNVTQVELAEKLKKPQSYVSKYESGERRLDIIEFLEIAELLSIDPIDFFRKLGWN